MNELKINETYSISIKELFKDNFYQKYHSTFFGYIINEDDPYYDLIESNGNILLCCDGEDCKVINKTPWGYEFLSTQSDNNRTFFLTNAEVDICVFK